MKTNKDNFPYYFLSFSLLLLIVLHSGVFTPLYLLTNSDVAWRNTGFPTIFYSLSEFSGYLFHWVFLAVIICVDVRKKYWNCFAIFCVSSFLHYACATVATILVMGSSSFRLLYVWNVIEAISETFLDCFLAFLAGFLIKKGNTEKKKILLSLIPVSGFRILSRLFYDIYFGDIGKSDIIMMVLYYLLDIALFFIGYAVIILITKLYRKIERKKLYQESEIKVTDSAFSDEIS